MMTPTHVGPIEGTWCAHTRTVRISNGMEFTYEFEDAFEDDGECRKNLHLATRADGAAMGLGHTYQGSLVGQQLVDAIEAALARRATYPKRPTL
jgi:hypothetical protein